LSKRRRKKRRGLQNLRKLVKSKSISSIEKDIESTCSEGESDNDLIKAQEKKIKKLKCIAQLKEKLNSSTIASLESEYGKYLTFEPRKVNDNSNNKFRKKSNGKSTYEKKIKINQQKEYCGNFQYIKKKEQSLNLEMSTCHTNTVQELQSSIQNSRQENSKILSKYHKLNLEFAQLQTKFEKEKTDKENSLHDFKFVKTELESTKLELEMYKSEVEKQILNKKELQSVVDKLEDELNLSINKTQHKRDIRKLQKDMNDIRNENLDQTSNYKALLKTAQLDVANADIKAYTSQAELKSTETENHNLIKQNSDLRAQVEILKIRNNELMFIQDVSTQHLSNMLAIAGRALAEKEKTDKLLAETVANSEVQFKLSTKDRQFIGEMQKTLNKSKFKVFTLQNEVEEKLKDQEKHHKLDLFKLKHKLDQVNSNLLEKHLFMLQISEKQRKHKKDFSALCSSASLETKTIVYNHLYP